MPHALRLLMEINIINTHVSASVAWDPVSGSPLLFSSDVYLVLRYPPLRNLIVGDDGHRYLSRLVGAQCASELLLAIPHLARHPPARTVAGSSRIVQSFSLRQCRRHKYPQVIPSK